MPETFTSILDLPPTKVERPKPLPQGTYVTVIVGMPRYDKSAKKQTSFIEFQHRMVAAGEDVDKDALDDALGDRALTDVVMKNTLYDTPLAGWRIKEFLQHCGFDIDDDSTSMREMVEQTAGKTVGVYLTHVPTQDGQGVFARIDRTVTVE